MNVGEWHSLKKSLDRDAFSARFAYPFLVWEHVDPLGESGISFRTQVGDVEDALATPVGLLVDATILPVKKKPENPYPDRISVGRAGNCDVVLRDPSVSKLHAQLVLKNRKQAEISDRGSSNGTRVNGKIVTSEPVLVSSGDLIVLGSVAVTFLDAPTLWDRL